MPKEDNSVCAWLTGGGDSLRTNRLHYIHLNHMNHVLSSILHTRTQQPHKKTVHNEPSLNKHKLNNMCMITIRVILPPTSVSMSSNPNLYKVFVKPSICTYSHTISRYLQETQHSNSHPTKHTDNKEKTQYLINFYIFTFQREQP